MKKLSFIVLFTVLLLFSALPTNAQEPASVKTIIQEESITTQDLEVPEPTLLPSSPFYFLKEWTRGIRKAFTFNPVKKLQLEVRFADERIVEAKRLAAQAPQQTQAIEQALENYRRSQTRLKTELASLEETSKNPEVDKLLEKLTDRGIKHEKLLAQLKDKFDEKAELKTKFDTAKEELEESIGEAAKKDGAEKFAKRLEKVLVETRGSDLKHLRSLEILDRVSKKVPEEFKENLSKIRDDFSLRFKEDVEAFVEKHQEQAPELIKEALENIPGEKARRVVIIEEIRDKAEKRVQEALKGTEKLVEKIMEEKEEFKEDVQEAIEEARELGVKIEKEILERERIPQAVRNLASQASLHLEKAVSAFQEGKYEEAFGQARSSHVLARNALRMLEEREEPEGEELREDLTELEEKLLEWEKKIELVSEEFKPKAKEVLEQSRFHLRLANETFQKGVFLESKKHLEEAKAAQRKLERIFYELKREVKVQKAPVSVAPRPVEEVKPAPAETREVLCTQEYEPVCGADGKTYPNACYASTAGVAIKYKGKCEEVKPEATAKPVPVVPVPEPEVSSEPKPTEEAKPVPSTPPIIELKVEADDKGFYPTNTLTVEKGVKVKLTFSVRSEGVYYGGLDFRSEKFTTPSVKPGGVASVEFSADESFTITSYWPASGVKKADLKIEVK